MKSIPKSLETVCSDLKPRDLHFRPECDDTQLKCGAHKSWVEGFNSGATAVLESEQIKALEEVLNHALEMGHFTSGGSTEKWAKDALADFRAWRNGK